MIKNIILINTTSIVLASEIIIISSSIDIILSFKVTVYENNLVILAIINEFSRL